MNFIPQEMSTCGTYNIQEERTLEMMNMQINL